ncbi:MAG: hypothetical protein ACE5GJ_10945 [Gemmatimonadota bacterium]
MLRTNPPLLAALTACALSMPVGAQENLVTLGAFVTVRTENVPDFESAVREHTTWHASQSDPQAWVAYQAVTGSGEYVILAPDMTWASLDGPIVDMGTDLAHWAKTGAHLVDTEEIVLWSQLPNGNPPEDATQYPVVQVLEFDINSGGNAAAMHAIEQASEALSRTGLQFEWSTVVSADASPSVFLALWFENFEALGTPGPGADRIMADAFGPGQGARVLADFSEATTAKSSQIWVMRPDLSYVPSM